MVPRSRALGKGQLDGKIPALPALDLGAGYLLRAALVVVSGSVDKILTSGALIIAPVVICYNLLGYLFGYLAGRVGAAP